jgi:hypothetical protein
MDYFDFVTAYEELCRDRMIAEGLRKSEEVLDATGPSGIALRPDSGRVGGSFHIREPDSLADSLLSCSSMLWLEKGSSACRTPFPQPVIRTATTDIWSN